MNEFQPGKPMFSSDQVEAAINGHFNRGMPKPEVQQPVELQEEMIQLTKADYEALMASRIQQPEKAEQSAETQQEVPQQEHFDPMKALDELFSNIAAAGVEGEPETKSEEIPKQEPVKSVEAQQIDRVKEYTNNFYGEVGRIAETKYGINQKQAVDIVANLTPDEIAQVAYAKILTQKQQAVNNLPKPIRMNPPKTISGGQSATLPTNSQQEVYQRTERNPFAY